MRRLGYSMSIGMFIFASCSGTSSETTNPPQEQPAYSVKMLTRLEGGRETEHCQFFTVPAPGLWVNRSKSTYTTGMHHMLLWTTEYAEIPTTDEEGNTVDTSKPFDCPEGPNQNWRTIAVAGGLQSAGSPDLLVLPDKVAFRLEPGVVLINMHILNATRNALDIEGKIDFFTIPHEEIEHEAGITFFYNYFIRVPPRSSSSARMSCPVTEDIFLVNAQSHMHRRGRGYAANIMHADGTSEVIYQHEQGNENVPVQQFGAGMRISRGSAIDFRCDYRSQEDGVVMQGPTSKDEMCMFFGAYYPRSATFEWCAPTEELVAGPPSLAGTFYGSGSASCGETLGCIAASDPNPFSPGFQSCVIDSCPQVAPQISDVARCMMAGVIGGGACDETCNRAPEMCGDCIQAACGAELGACAQAGCTGAQ